MNRTRLAELATRLLKDHPPAAGAHLGDRAGTVSALERALAARARRRKPLPLLVLGAAAAAAMVLIGTRVFAPTSDAVTATWTSPGGATFVRGETSGQYQPGQSVLAGDHLHTRAPAQLALSTGTMVSVAPASDIEVVELGVAQRLALQKGVLRAHVHKLETNQAFSVTTPDALITVRGTDFEVEVGPDAACAGRAATRVRVFEGVVSVNHAGEERRLLPGQSWSSPCQHDVAAPVVEDKAAAPMGTKRPRAQVARPRRDLGRASAAAPLAVPAEPDLSPSTLPEQNDLLQGALAARQRGDKTTALRLLDDLLARFPRGPLAGPAARARRELATSAP